MITMENVCKSYRIAKRNAGLAEACRALFHREYEEIHALKNVSFTINDGEMVGYIGPNGAGKSSTIKILSGILTPDSGHVAVDGRLLWNSGGRRPSQKQDRCSRIEHVRQIGVVFGQRSQLWWDVPVIDSFELLKDIYSISEPLYRNNLEELTELLNLGELLRTPTRQLSLGQRMRCEIAASLLHSPKILFLDEPTIGLDIDAKQAIRDFILEMNRRKKTTVILTSHDLDDVMKLCTRLIVINKGVIVEDGPIDEIVSRMATYRMLILEVAEPVQSVSCDKVEVMKIEGRKIWCKFDHHAHTAAEIIHALGEEMKIVDLSVREPDVEDAISNIYHS